MFGPTRAQVLAQDGDLARYEAYRDAFVRGSAIVQQCRGWSPWATYPDESPPDGISLFENSCVREILHQISLFAALRAADVRFDAVGGVSLGEIPAGYAAGLLTLEDAVRLSCEAAAASMAADDGDLVLVHAEPARTRAALGDLELETAIHAPMLSVWAVPTEKLAPLESRLKTAGIAHIALGFECLPHTPRVDYARVEQVTQHLTAREPEVPFYACTAGGVVNGPVDAAFWVRLCSEPVRLTEMLDALLRGGHEEIAWIGTVRIDRDLDAARSGTASSAQVVEAESLLPARPIADPAPALASALSSERDLTSPAFARDPHAFYRAWRAAGSVHRLTRPDGWLVMGYDDAAGVLRDPARYSSAPFRSYFGLLHGADPPDHTRIRRALTPFFTTARQQGRVDAVRARTQRAVKELRERRECAFDLIADFAAPLPHAITCEWLGLDEASTRAILGVKPNEVTWEMVEGARRDDGLLSELLAHCELTREEIVELTPFLLTAGLTTVSDFIGPAVYALLRNAPLRDALRRDETIADSLIEELFRLEPPVHTLMRCTQSDVLLGGHTIPAGSTVWVSLAAANRDPQRFDSPDEFRVDRDGPRALSFGHGPHFCLGSHLGRLECEIILATFIAAFPGLRLADPAAPVRFEGLPVMRRIASLPLAFDRTR